MKFSLFLLVFVSLAISSQAAPMVKRRFGQEHTPAAEATYAKVRDLAAGSDKSAQAGDLSGAMVRALLAKAPTCDQQDRADDIIDLGRTFGGKIEKEYIKVAKKYRQLERNTPKVGQPSALCTKPPKNSELNGLVQAQDPTGKGGDDPNPPKKCHKGKKKECKKGGKKGSTNFAETNPVGGVKMPRIVKKDGDFFVNGNKFNGDVNAAHSRQCDIQHNLCFNKFNSGDRSFTGQDCDNQTNVCKEGPPVFA